MKVIELSVSQDITSDKSLNYTYSQFEKLLVELRRKNLPENVIELINQDIKEVNSSAKTGKGLRKLIEMKHTRILALVKKELKLIPEGHYRTLWMVLGMSVFGLPLGIIYGNIVDNMGLLTLGLPVGLGIGIMVGMWMDNKVKKEGRQLNLEDSDVQS